MATRWRNFHNSSCVVHTQSHLSKCHTDIWLTSTIGANVCLTGFLHSGHTHQIKGRSSWEGEREFTGVHMKNDIPKVFHWESNCHIPVKTSLYLMLNLCISERNIMLVTWAIVKIPKDQVNFLITCCTKILRLTRFKYLNYSEHWVEHIGFCYLQ